MEKETSYQRVLPAILLEILLKETDEDRPLLITSSDSNTKTIFSILKEEYEININSRTVNRTLSAMMEAGLVGHKPGKKKGGYYACRDIDIDSIKIILYSLYGSNNLGNKLVQEIISYLTTSIGVSIQKDFSKIYKADEPFDPRILSNIVLLNKAIESDKKVHFEYYFPTASGKPWLGGLNNPKYPNIISPLSIISKRGDFYLLYTKDAFGNIYSLRLDNIYSIEILDKEREIYHPFDPYEFMKHRAYVFSGELIDFKIQFDKEEGRQYRRNIKFVLQYFKDSVKFEEDKKNDVLYASIRTDEGSFFWWYIQYGENFTILSPESMIERVKAHYQKLVKKYS